VTNNEAVALCVKAQGGDTDAAQQLVAAHYELVRIIAWSWATTLRQSPDGVIEGGDLVGDCVLFLYERIIPEFDASRGVYFRTRLRRQLRSHLLSRERRQRRNAHQLRYLDTEEPSMATDEGAGDLERLVDAAEARGVINKLAAHTLRLRGQGLTAAEVARIQGCSTKACQKRYERARRAIQGETWNS